MFLDQLGLPGWLGSYDDEIPPGQIIATNPPRSPQMVVKSKGNGTPYFREIYVREILSFGHVCICVYI